MFDVFPGYVWIETISPLRSVIRPTEFFHSVVTDTTYLSLGVRGRNELHCIFHYTIKGRGRVTYRGKDLYTAPGEGFLHIINEEDSGYGYPENGTEPWEFVVICFDGGNVREIFEELLSQQVVYSVPPVAITMLCREFVGRRMDAGEAAQIFSRLLSLLGRTEASQLVEDFLRLARERLLCNPTVAALAAELGVSREHLQRSVSLQCGISCARYLSKLRLEELCRQLLRTDVTEKEIALRMNFGSAACMSTFFKRMTGITPGQYRKNGI